MSSHVMLKFNRLLRFNLLEKKIVQEIYKILYLRKFYLEFPLWENYMVPSTQSNAWMLQKLVGKLFSKFGETKSIVVKDANSTPKKRFAWVSG